MLPLIKTRNRYPERADAIIKKMRSYTNSSFMNCLYAHFQQYRKSDKRLVMNFPWCCFLALKWKFSAVPKEAAAEMSRTDFDAIISRIYQLQDEAADLERKDGILLEMRRMVISQTFYQTDVRLFIMSLSRQHGWFCGSDTPYFRENFRRLTGFNLDSYYRMAFFLTLYVHLNEQQESGTISVDRLIVWMVPLFGVQELKAFLQLVSLRPDEVGEFCLQHRRDTRTAEEYYERTPFIRKPLYLSGDTLIMFSKHLLAAGLSTLVPDLLCEQLPDTYGQKFGKVVERYLEDHLRKNYSNLINEKELLGLYKRFGMTGKVVDYLIKEGDAYVYIDSKAVSPHRHLRESASVLPLQNKIKSNLVEGLQKAEKCAAIINGIEGRPASIKDSAIIVVHQDHFISTGRFIAANIQPDVFDNLRSDIGYLPVPEERIYYLTVDEFETLTDVCRIHNLTLTEIIDRCAEADSVPLTQKMNFYMHLTGMLPHDYARRGEEESAHSTLLSGFADCMRQSAAIWDGKVETFMQIKQELLRKD
ncbi:GapS1 family protein (plasmid) [Enterobacter ludwigii]